MQYTAPLRDIRFAMHELLDSKAHYARLSDHQELDTDTINSYLEAAADFAQSVIAPLNRTGDMEGCRFENGEVYTPTGFKQAYEQYCELGFPAIAADPAFGGMGLPTSIGSAINEIMGTANWSFSMYPGLSHGAIATIEHHGTDEQKATYLENMNTGRWSGTMCLTEAHAGSDLGLIKTRAVPNADGSYAITGQKIFISAGEHDLTENIIHIVLARLPDAPAGTKGISLFIVPKFIVNADGSLGARNGVTCGSIEHKMGIKASATCVMNFDGATGYLIGPKNRGLNCMFTFMNVARIGTAIQGLAAAEFAFQGSLTYAKDRTAMRSLSGAKDADKPADRIIHHPAVRNMLMTQKAFSEGGRALVCYLSQFADVVAQGESGDVSAKDVKYADEMLSLLTPIAKAFLTETGYEAANLGVQVYGGHGFISEWGMEQNVRDTRIACLYEGTTEIQSLDLLARKVLGSQGRLLANFTKIIHKFCVENAENDDVGQMIRTLAKLNKQWGDLTSRIALQGTQNPEAIGAAAVDYLYFSGYVTLGYLWARAAVLAKAKLAQLDDDLSADTSLHSEYGFYDAKVKTAEFYFAKLMPRTAVHVARINSGESSLMAMDIEQFAF
ncbi:acyl-CoA dehydrogenase [Moraxella caviae]|uniref:3-methylmercaptopropionyl-CoA dehydrogenase n=1 Tax=Moraxella caviae TaxID=34060 RepID=A0A1T0A3H6_9GAMM|nr:acyl-CoA dehydrogenase C-terminal domain-containing protein [Moraxella caviae]OOR89891.1 acyl-CoA dehydrogenase [Moraxella caviae]STZ14276.1 Acyl-CoA dehydrogenase, short-chain specific [Moraxella caviae]VEW10732.1 Acyl-CoA dehydrogenase, short-chain specific [Moraxella caviae]